MHYDTIVPQQTEKCQINIDAQLTTGVANISIDL